MLQGKKSRRIIAATLLTIMLTNTLAPTVSYALTSGPTAPEATSFEPVDTTDMVNLQTGDFTYNIPIMEVPGPEGGYPLSLSYHAGIQPGLDASWVGLGWTLNPGAITRNVNGYPDDWHDVSQVIRDYWSGGETKSFGVNLGLALGPANVSFGLSFAHDTYKGYGVGHSAGIGIGVANGVSLGLSFSASPFGGSVTTELGVQFGAEGSPVSGSLGVSTDGNSISGSGSINVGGVGFSLSTAGSVGVSVTRNGFGAGASVAYNNSAGNIQTSSRGFTLPLGAISLSWNYTRYWSDETANIKTHGAMYMYMPDLVWEGGYNGTGTRYNSFDVYHLHDDPKVNNLAEEPDVRKVPGGTFPDNDIYQVTSQGLGGAFRPYAYQERLLIQTTSAATNNDPFSAGNPGRVITDQFPAGTAGKPQSKIHFRFMDDFSNTFRQDPLDFTTDANLINYYNFDNTSKYGNKYGVIGYDATRNKLAGSKNIEFYTNRQINSTEASSKGFLDVNTNTARGFSRQADDLIGGFSITNEKGVTYHYALPAYAYDEMVYSENMPSERSAQGHIWNKVRKSAKYAYTWFLTSITGSDFVDKNGSGTADDGDWGYWVNFEYGKWADGFNWRNPSEGFHRDLDTKFQDYSKGKKEIYYLNVIKTRTHAALFEKNIRYDGKGTSDNSMGIDNHDGSLSNVFDGTSKSVMQLDKIYLLPRSGFDESSVSYNVSDVGMYSNIHMAGNVLDKNDMDPVRAVLTGVAIKVVDFAYDNTLCEGTSNSFDYNAVGTKKGKLTLKKLLTRGKGGASLMPPQVFNYELPANEAKTASVTVLDQGFARYKIQTVQPNQFEEGDVVRFEKDGKNFYCTIVYKESEYLYIVLLINPDPNISVRNFSTLATTTKNPCYATDNVDSWGMFKSDYSPWINLSNNENVTRKTTRVSSKAVDVWSLRSIKTPLGATIGINYQSDTYRKPVLNDHVSYVLSQDGPANMSARQITFSVMTGEIEALSNYFKVGQDLTYYLTAAEYGKGNWWYNMQYLPGNTSTLNPGHTAFKYTVAAINSDINGNYITVNFAVQDYAAGLVNIDNLNDVKVIANLRVLDANDKEFYGGGIRVKNLEIKDAGSGMVKRAVYSYSNLDAGITSGVTPYSPQLFPQYDRSAFTAMYSGSYGNPLTGGWDNQTIGEKNFKKVLYKDMNYLLAISRELPGAGVIYEYVTVYDEVQNPDEPTPRSLEGRTVFQHEVFNANMIGIKENTQRRTVRRTQGSTYIDYVFRNMSLKDYTSRLGLLKRVVKYDNGNRKLTETINNYLHDDIKNSEFIPFSDSYDALIGSSKYDYQGLVQERFASSRYLLFNGESRTYYLANMREEFPAVPTGTTEINYVTGAKSSTEISGFDYYSGDVTQKVIADVYGNRFLSEVIPAYRQYPALGLKLTNATNKNMLTQQAATYLYKVNGNNDKLGLVSASVNTWSSTTPVIDVNGNTIFQNNSSNGDVWRSKTTYVYTPATKTVDGLTPLASFSDYNWSNPSAAAPAWKVNSNITLYDVYSHSLEMRDLNTNYLTAKMDYGNKKVNVTGNLANYYEIAYSGAEDASVVQQNNVFVKKADANVSWATAHTGARSLKLSGLGQKGFVYTVNTDQLTAGRTYVANVWVKPLSTTTTDVKLYYTINGVEKGISSLSSGNTAKTANGWALVDLVIKGTDITPGATLVVGCRNDATASEAYLDDFRFRPLNSTSTAYVHDALSGELIYVLDNNNLYTKYEYDAAGRLKGVYIEKLGMGQFKAKEFQYNFGAGRWSNTGIINQLMYKNDCPSGPGAGVYVTVPEGKHISYVSADDANALAAADAQQQANAQGTCVNMYAKITYENLVTIGGRLRGNVVVSFYSDPQCTNPFNANNIHVVYNTQSVCPTGCQQPPAGHITGKTLNGYSDLLASGWLSDPGGGSFACQIKYNLLPNDKYQIAP
jgi:hypothetical protein